MSDSTAVVCVEVTLDEAEWLSAAARRASEDTIVPGAAELLRALAEKLAEAAA